MKHNVSLLIEAVPQKQFIIMLFIVASTLCACQMKKVSLLEPEPGASIAPVEVDPRIFSLLAKAEAAFAEDRLTTPLDDNAYLRYLQVLSIDPDSEKANQGIANIVEKYLAWSIEKFFRPDTDAPPTSSTKQGQWMKIIQTSQPLKIWSTAMQAEGVKLLNFPENQPCSGTRKQCQHSGQLLLKYLNIRPLS